ncbi:hypothetical protein RchiOBHm_Chr6g0277391 [Rosa chinensis]|uniref:Uncharacterized protein n=1 Tax=Rosa chinensis TaxID=74649 RepID=A0A2P6PSJ3_ROSCH|nr:hypothetical protein RchiOBHm_Chr6g0277391 [Rosa chinensis]
MRAFQLLTKGHAILKKRLKAYFQNKDKYDVRDSYEKKAKESSKSISN